MQRFSDCADSVSQWMSSNRLRIYPSKAGCFTTQTYSDSFGAAWDLKHKLGDVQYYTMKNWIIILIFPCNSLFESEARIKVYSWNENLEIIDFSMKTLKTFQMNVSNLAQPICICIRPPCTLSSIRGQSMFKINLMVNLSLSRFEGSNIHVLADSSVEDFLLPSYNYFYCQLLQRFWMVMCCSKKMIIYVMKIIQL